MEDKPKRKTDLRQLSHLERALAESIGYRPKQPIVRKLKKGDRRYDQEN